MSKPTPELLAEGLIREFLARKGYSQTLEMFDLENPRDESTINSKTALLKGLKLEKAAKKNKAKHNYSSVLEVACWYLPTTKRPSTAASSSSSSGTSNKSGRKSANSGSTLSASTSEETTTVKTRKSQGISNTGKVNYQTQQTQQNQQQRYVFDEHDLDAELSPSDFRSETKQLVMPPNYPSPLQSQSHKSQKLKLGQPLGSKQGYNPSGESLLSTGYNGSGYGNGNGTQPHVVNSSGLFDDVDSEITPMDRFNANSGVPSQPRSPYYDDDGRSSSTLSQSSSGDWTTTSRPSPPSSTSPDVRHARSHVRKPRKTSASSSGRKVRGYNDSASGGDDSFIDELAGGGPPRPTSRQGFLQLEDVEDFEAEFDDVYDDDDYGGGGVSMGGFQSNSSAMGNSVSDGHGGYSIGYTLEDLDISSIRTLIFGKGSHKSKFNEEWRQGFYFNDNDALRYGLVQTKGGPCGVIASVQAHILHSLMESCESQQDILIPSDVQRHDALVQSLCEILWTISDEGLVPVRVALLDKETFRSGRCKQGFKPILESVQVHIFNSYDSLIRFMRANEAQFVHKSGVGVPLLVFSAILTRTVDGVLEDMDQLNGGKLMGQNWYCSQELVNLLLLGKALSHTHDGVIDVSGKSDAMFLQGLDKQSLIGFLSLFEAYNCMNVGNLYKSPKAPIWVVCCESHFSIMFCLDWPSPRASQFDIYYYDQLAKQQEEYRLTLDVSRTDPVEFNDKDPPLELVFRTKWPNAIIDWNGLDVLM